MSTTLQVDPSGRIAVAQAGGALFKRGEDRRIGGADANPDKFIFLKSFPERTKRRAFELRNRVAELNRGGDVDGKPPRGYVMDVNPEDARDAKGKTMPLRGSEG